MNKKKAMKKLFILFAVMLTLAMLIPMAAIPVSAAGGDSAVPSAVLGPDPQHDISGDIATFAVTGLGTSGVTVVSFNATTIAGSAVSINGTSALPGGDGAWIAVYNNGVGEASIVANLSDGSRLSAVKKWGEINATDITPPQNVVVNWFEGLKTFEATANVTDTVWGTFLKKNETTLQYTDTEEFKANGAILTWYLLADTPDNQELVQGAAGSLDQAAVTALTAQLVAAEKANFATFGPITVPPQPVISTKTTVSGDFGPDGVSRVDVNTNGEEPVLVVALPWYPVSTQYTTFLEWTKINFWTSEMEKVPQVRWAGEKIVLEKYFGPEFAGALVRFSLENQSPGSLEGLQGTQLGNLNNTAQTVWDVVSSGSDPGWARCMLVSEDQGEVDVDLALYNQWGDTIDSRLPPDPAFTAGSILNQHGFVVFYMKLESITLGNVIGKRAGELGNPFETDDGLFDPGNPVWDYGTNLNPIASPDDVTGTFNVSADTLLRARVKGWFMGDNMSSRPARVQDADPTHPGVYTYTLPAGRWILPDDWPVLAGPNWKEMRIHWDIMNAPNDGIVFDENSLTTGLGPYVFETSDRIDQDILVAAAPVIGPFRPGLEVPTATGYDPNINPVMAATYDDALNVVAPWAGQKTVVPNGNLDWWDAPMPPAKITFELLNVAAPLSTNSTIDIGDAGFFKDAFKTDIYYVMEGPNLEFTNPFYFEMIPAFRWIPAFVNNGGYDWNSWNAAYGPYEFWKIINRPTNTEMPLGRDTDSANFPSKAQVYSDNHGEAMIYVNGDFALNPLLFTKEGLGIPFGSQVGSSTIVAIADYPYFRKHNQLISNIVVKNWLWGGMVLGPTEVGPNSLVHQMILSVASYAGTHPADPTGDAMSNKLMIWVWVTDRDGEQDGVLNTRVDWTITGGNVDIANFSAGHGTDGFVSDVNGTMKSLQVTNGFLDDTKGMINPQFANRTGGVSWTKDPTAAEKVLFNKFWGAGGSDPIIGVLNMPVDPDNFAVAAIVLEDLSGTMSQDPTVAIDLNSPDFGTLSYHYNVAFGQAHPLDDNILAGDANLDGKVTMGDVTAIERMILGMAPAVVQADANYNDKINMGDVVKVERTILGIIN